MFLVRALCYLLLGRGQVFTMRLLRRIGFVDSTFRCKQRNHTVVGRALQLLSFMLVSIHGAAICGKAHNSFKIYMLKQGMRIMMPSFSHVHILMVLAVCAANVEVVGTKSLCALARCVFNNGSAGLRCGAACNDNT